MHCGCAGSQCCLVRVERWNWLGIVSAVAEVAGRMDIVAVVVGVAAPTVCSDNVLVWVGVVVPLVLL